MAYSPVEEKFLSALSATQFPPEVPMADKPIEPIVVAEVSATKMPDQGYTGQSPDTMKEYDPTVRERLSEFLQGGFERIGMDRYKARKNAESIIGGPNSNLPLDMGLADIVPFLGTALQTQEAIRMGESAVEDVKQGNLGTAAIEAVGAGLGMLPGGAATAKTVKAAAKAAKKGTK